MNGKEQVRIDDGIADATVSGYRRFPAARFYASVIVMLLGFGLSVVFLSFLISAISWFPDIDLMLNPFLHHRSIITHSILIPGLLALLFSRFTVARLLIGIIASAISVHLFADVLSPTFGFGEIWIPPGTFLTLGDLSAAFIFLNAAASFAFAITVFPDRLRSALAAATLLSGLQYGMLNEQSARATVFISVMLVLVAGLLVWRGKIAETPDKLIAGFRARRDQELSCNAEHAKAEREMWASMSPMKRARAKVVIAGMAVYTALRWVIGHPGKIVVSGCAIAAIVGALYFIGSASRNNASGALSVVGNGIWVLHSSGGYIMTEGGKYVAGTMRGSPPESSAP